MTRLNSDETDALQNPDTARVILIAKKTEIAFYKKNLKKVQDESSAWLEKYIDSRAIIKSDRYPEDG